MPNMEHLMYPPVAGYTFEQPDEHDKKLVANILGVQLPKALTELLAIQNGGLLRFNTHASPEPNGWASDHVPVESIWGISVNGDNCLNVSAERAGKWRLPKGLVPFSGDSWGCVCLDYRGTPKGTEPAVAWAEGATKAVRLAPDFGSFLTGLVRGEPKHIFGMIGELTETEATALVAGVFGGELTPAEEGGFGIIGWLSKWRSMTDDAQPAEVWLTQNKRPNGWLEYPEWRENGLLLGLDITREGFEECRALLDKPDVLAKLHAPVWRG
jgi:hypothetical protein